MLHSLHVFIGKGFEKMLDSVGRTIINQHKDSANFNHFFNVSKEKNGKISFEKLNTQELASSGVAINDNLNIWCEKQSISSDDLSDYWSDNIFDKVLNIANTGQDTLYVFIHLALYRKETINTAKLLCQAIRESERPVNIDFIGYCDDMARFIEPDSKEEPEQSSEALSAIKEMYGELGYVHQQNKFIVIQNRTINGVSILNDEMASDCLYDMVANLSILFSAHYDDIFSLSQIASRDVMGIGFSSLYFDRYAFSEYLLKKIMLKSIDNQQVNNNYVDVNRATDAANEILKGKEEILSKFLERWKGKEKERPDYDELKNEIEGILKSTMNYFTSCKDMTAKTAILATLLSKTECPLFSSSLYSPTGTNFEDLYSGAIDMYIEEDSIEYYKIGDGKPVNPIKELKTVNCKIIQSEVAIRSLEEQMNTYSEQIKQNEKVRECLIDDGFFTIGENKFRMLPTVDEIPLEETYAAHEVTAQSVDLRSNFSRIKNQGQQGSCLAFTLTSVFEYVMKLNNQGDCDLSESFLYYNARHLDENGSVNEDNGSKFVPSLEALRTYGIALEKVWPYNEEVCNNKPTEEAYNDAATRKLIKALNVERNVDAIKSALSDGHPVAASFTLFESFSTTDAYVPMPSSDEMEALENSSEDTEWKHSYHAMVIVGYSDKLQRFLVRNSWGEDWGDHGYCYIPYDYIANQKLLNFACIITEVASLASSPTVLKEIPALEINNTDVKIRYYVTAAACDVQKKALENFKEEKNNLLQYLEIQKTLYADPNNREEFINKSVAAIEDTNSSLRESITSLKSKQDEIFEVFKELRKKTIIKFAIFGLVTIVLLCLWIYIGKHANAWLKAKDIDFSFNLVSGFAWMAVAWGVYGIISYIRFKNAYNCWREERDELEMQINNCKAAIAANEKRKELFRHRIFAAWMTLNSLRELYPKLEQLYQKMVSLINNLRVWYDEAKNSIDDKEFVSSFPNISMLNKERLNKYFEERISDSSVCEIDLCEGIEGHEVTAEYLGAYKYRIKEKLVRRLEEMMKKIDFNMSEHVATNKFPEIVSEIDAETLNSWNRQAGIFLYVKSNERAVIPTDNLCFASNLKATRNNLSKKLNNLDVSSYGESDDRYKITLVRVATLDFEECVAFQTTNKRKK